ncbi:MAG: choice-of-anchor J domain-containing protein [Bacteroidales bacterium]|nr:choice-of-anchor J domain-containing protein [Bacteroidales bacterium]
MKKIIFTLLTMSLVAFFTVAQAQNLVVNGDLETWSSDTSPTGWTKAESISKESTTIHGGSFAAKHTSGESTLKFSQDVTGIEAGTTYTISYYYYDNSDMARTRIWAYWMDAANTYINDNEDVLRPTTYSQDQDAWIHYSQVLTAPAGAAKFRFEVRVYKQDGTFGGAVYYDDFSISGDLIIKPEPTNYPTAFTAEAEDVGVRLNWTDATGAQLPDAYLIIGETGATKEVNFDLPVDGTPVANNTDMSLGYIAWNVPFGQSTHLFSNLEAGTTYHFAIFPYTNLGENIDYKNSAGYPEATAETSNVVVLLNEPFDSSLGVMSAYNVLGDQVWSHSTFGDDQFAKMSGFAGGAQDNEDWLISPVLDFTNLEKVNLSFRAAYSYDGNPLQLMVSSDYDGTGNPNDFTWTDLTNQFDWSSGGFEWVESGAFDILSYASPKLYVAFKYTSTTSAASTWEVDYVRVIGEGSVGVSENKMLDIQVYPNPAVDQLNFTLAEQADVQVIDLSGKIVMQQKAVAGNSRLNVADLTQGMYIVYFNFANGTQAVSRFAKQ